MHVLALRVELRIPHSQSLKDKRQVTRSLLDRARNRLGVASAEVGSVEHHQSAVLGFAAVSSSSSHAEEMIDSVERLVWSRSEVEVLSCERTWSEWA